MRNQTEEITKKEFSYNLDDLGHKQIIREFEQEFNASGFTGAGAFYFWLRSLDLVDFAGNDWKNWQIPVQIVGYDSNYNPVLTENSKNKILAFKEFHLKWDALANLRIRREKAQLAEMSPEEKEAYWKKWDEMKRGIKNMINKISERSQSAEKIIAEVKEEYPDEMFAGMEA